MNFIRTIIATPRQRHVLWVTLAVSLGVGVTVRLGCWQLARAQEKQDRHIAIASKMAAPVLSTQALLAQPERFKDVHRAVDVEGVWQPQHTVFLENRPMGGRTGFWVLTPLALDANHWLLVQRGWLPRHQLDRSLLAPFDTPTGRVQVQGRLAPPPSDLMTLAKADERDVPAVGANNIRQNLDLPHYAQGLDAELMAVVLQTGPASDGLLRDWPEISAGVEKHHAYAFQWFALAALQLVLYFWFQWIKPYRYVRKTTT
jgi:surfeit locus 1 family protein